MFLSDFRNIVIKYVEKLSSNKWYLNYMIIRFIIIRFIIIRFNVKQVIWASKIYKNDKRKYRDYYIRIRKKMKEYVPSSLLQILKVFTELMRPLDMLQSKS